MRPFFNKSASRFILSQHRSFSSKKDFDYQAFEEEIRQSRQKNRNQEKNPGSSYTDSTNGASQQPSTISLTP